ncbi:MAG: hypothetical protein ACYST0_14355 [Planctomycetota bacterium]
MIEELRFRDGEARFSWQQTRGVLADLLAEHPKLELDDRSRSFVAGDVSFTPPLVQRIRGPHIDPTSYLDHISDQLGTHLVLLLQAGAAALGIFQDGELTHHKVIKKYVVRGHGKAQPTHLKTRGKSRYGSRLRLANYRKLLVEVNEKLGQWAGEVGALDDRFYSCPVRTWPELFDTRPPPPFPRQDFVRIPLDLAVPSLTELERAWRGLCLGTLVQRRSAGAPRGKSV